MVAPPLPDRLRAGLDRLAQNPPSSLEAPVADALRRTFTDALGRLGAPPEPNPDDFLLKMTGTQPLVFLKGQALPLDCMNIVVSARACGVEFQAGESIVLDMDLVAGVLNREVARVSAEFRAAEEALRRAMAPRERDHAAAGVADRNKIQLRGRLNRLVSALQSARKAKPE